MDVILYKNFSKKSNSTKVPTDAGTTVSAYLKEQTSIESPVFKIDGIDLDVNYVKFNDHYYFVDDIVLGNDNIYEVHCTQDLLATYKSSILASTQYVVRSASANDGYLIDTMYPSTDTVSSSWALAHDTIFTYGIASGYFILGIVNKDTATVGAVSYFCLTNAQMRTLLNVLLSDTSYIGATSIEDTLLKAQFNPFQYIVSCMWVPWQPDHLGTAYSISLGWFDINVQCQPLSGLSTISSAHTTYVNLSDHPQVSRGKFLNGAPYTSRILHAGPFGNISLDTTKFVDATKVNLSVQMDFISGMGFMYVTSDATNGSGTMELRGQIGVPIQLAQVTTDYLNVISTGISGAASTVGAVVAENYVGAAATLSAMVMNAVDAGLPSLQTSGSNGNFCQLFEPLGVSSVYYNIADESLARLGRPYCKPVTLSSLSGFTKCLNASVDSVGFANDKIQLDQMLNDGFYIE